MATPETVTHSQQTNVQRLHFVLREFWCIHFLDFVSNYNPGLDFLNQNDGTLPHKAFSTAGE